MPHEFAAAFHGGMQDLQKQRNFEHWKGGLESK